MCWANLPPVQPHLEFGAILFPALLLVGAILVAVIILVAVRNWQKKPAVSDPVQEQLTRFRELYQRGEMSPEEYRRVHSLLAAKLREANDLPPAPAEAPAGQPRASQNGKPGGDGAADAGSAGN